MDTTIAAIVQFIVDAGGFAGIALLAGWIYKTIKDARDAKIIKNEKMTAAILAKAKLDEESLLAKAHVDTDAIVAKATIDKDALLAKSVVSKTKAETDDIIAKAADNMVTAMQKRMDALIIRVEATELQKDKEKSEYADAMKRLEKRVEILEELLITKEREIAKRDVRISELEAKNTILTAEIEYLKLQVSDLLAAKNKTE